MTLRHNNPSQEVNIPEFNPLLINESPYYKNLNRAPKNAYDYATNINNMFSYGGNVSRLQSLGNQNFNLYDVVSILDGELIDNVRTTSQVINRCGIVVTVADSEGYYLVVTFCPNFVYPAEVVAEIAGFAAGIPSGFGNGAPLYLDMTSNVTPQSNYWLTTTSTGNTPLIPLGKITGSYSIFFSGSVYFPTEVVSSTTF